MTARLSTALSRTVSWFVILPVSTFTCFAIGAESKEGPARKALNERVQPVIDALDKLCRQKTIYMIGPTLRFFSLTSSASRLALVGPIM